VRALRIPAVLAAVLALLLPPSSTAGAQQDPAGAPAVTSSAPAPLRTPVLSARRAPELLRSGITDRRIREALAPLLATVAPDACIVVANAGRPVVRVNGATPMVPASAQKLLTAVAVLATFDSEHRLETRLLAASAPRDGVVDGDVYLVGGGDPILTTPGYQRTFENPEQLSNPFAPLADRVAAAGIREIRGNIVGDDSRYDGERWVRTWPERYQREGYVGPLSALIVNDGTTGLSVLPDQPSAARKPGDPPTLAAETLKSYLLARGVLVRGAPVAGVAPPGAVEIARLESLPMRELVTEMIADSDNTTAELLVKELGHERAGVGSTEAGVRVVADTLRERGLPTDGLVVTDGSGLDTGNRASCDLLVAALDEEGPTSVLAQSLPIAGESGTLRKRMRNTPAQGRVRAKTGTLREVNALAGFATTVTGTTLTFAYVVNGPDQPLGYQPIDDFMAALVGVPDGPPLAELEPLHPGG
jgi:D-alanyl-D-alanine carboxypeptidase/D-alanyl-D-alanine-endopeptidase (penicillin-binding protein 4)